MTKESIRERRKGWIYKHHLFNLIMYLLLLYLAGTVHIKRDFLKCANQEAIVSGNNSKNNKTKHAYSNT